MSANSTTTINPPSARTQATRSLPSFAQSFSDPSLMKPPPDDPTLNALPPIQTLSPELPDRRPAASPAQDWDARMPVNVKKRARHDGGEDMGSGSE